MSESKFKNVIEYLIDSGAHMQMGIIYNTYERDRMRERERERKVVVVVVKRDD